MFQFTYVAPFEYSSSIPFSSFHFLHPCLRVWFVCFNVGEMITCLSSESNGSQRTNRHCDRRFQRLVRSSYPFRSLDDLLTQCSHWYHPFFHCRNRSGYRPSIGWSGSDRLCHWKETRPIWWKHQEWTSQSRTNCQGWGVFPLSIHWFPSLVEISDRGGKGIAVYVDHGNMEEVRMKLIWERD